MLEIQNLTKLYYTIGEVAEMFDVSTSLIRYWETEFKNLNPKKNRKGDRRFTVDQIKEVDKIYQLVKINGYTLDGAKKVLKEDKLKYKNRDAALSRLNKLHKQMKELKERL